MKLLVKARGYGTAEIEVEATRLTLAVAAEAAAKAVETEFPGAAYLTVYEAENVARGRVINVRNGKPHLVR